jgi:hypothetical protein
MSSDQAYVITAAERKVAGAAQAFATRALEIENQSHLVHRDPEAMRLLRAYEAALEALEAVRKPTLMTPEEAIKIGGWTDCTRVRREISPVLTAAHERAYRGIEGHKAVWGERIPLDAIRTALGVKP